MKKDAYYFPHFSNARNDSKIIKLRRVLGIEGYGIYFMLLEILREQTNFQFPISGIEDLSYEWHISKEKIISVIKDYDLFVINQFDFFSEKLILYLQPYFEKSKRATKANEIRWNRVKELRGNIQMDSICTPNKNPSKVNKVNKEEYIYSKFYDEQIELSKQNINSLYPHFVSWLFKTNINDRPLTKVLNMKDQITSKNFENYLKLYGVDRLKDTILNLDNYTKKTYSSFNSTINNWLKPKKIK